MIKKFFKKSEDNIYKEDDNILQLLQDNLQFIKKFFEELSNVVFFITDRDLIIKYANKSLEKILNLTNLEEKNLKIFIPPYVKSIPIPDEGKYDKVSIHLKCRKPDVNLSLSGYVLAQNNQFLFFLEKKIYNYHELYEKISDLNNEIARLTREYQKKENFIENLKSQLKDAMRKDVITEAYNRFYLKEVLDRELGRFKRYGTPLCLVIVDIENFKEINQNYGRTTGDMVLKQLSKLLIESTRLVDMVFRYEEDSFIILLPNTDIEGAKVVSKKIQIKVNSQLFEQNISISVRTAAIKCDKNDTVESVINNAYKAFEQTGI